MKKLLLVLVSLLSLISCGTDTVGTSSDVDVEIATLHGAVLSIDESPIEGALISLFSNDDTIPLDSKYSSISGEYSFDSVSEGGYKITASLDDSIYAILQNVVIEELKGEVISLDTLWLVQPGVIVGSVANYDGNGVIWVYIPGTSFIATVDSSGSFTMSGVAPDSNYVVMFDRYGHSSVAISGINVSSGDTTFLEPQSLTPNMYPQNLSAVFDSASNSVFLKWDRMDRLDIEGYIISRKFSELTAVLPTDVNDVLILDTFFVDTLHDTLFSMSDTISLQYRVQGQTIGFGERTGYSLPVEIEAVIIRDSSDYQSIVITSPSIEDTLLGFEAFTINWKYTGKVDSVEIFLTLDGGKNWNPISGAVLNRGEYEWPKVENAQSSSCQIKVVNIKNSAILGISSVFSIEMTPVDNILLNGDFSNGFKNWIPNIHNYDTTVDGSMEVDSNGILHVNVNKCEESWMIRIYQYPETPLYEFYEYEISFRAKATSYHKLISGAHTITGEYEHFVNATVYADTVWQEFKVPFIPNGDPSADNTVVSFVFGEEIGEIWLDDVKLNIVGLK